MIIPQGLLPFKVERTDELITPRSGLALFAEVMRAFRIEEKVKRCFPEPGSNRGYEAWAYVGPLLMMLEGGGRHVEDLREIRDDQALRELTGLEEMPSVSTFGDWLMRVGTKGGIPAVGRVVEETGERIWKRLATPEYTLDVDATVIEAEKKEAAWTYKKVRGYQPLLGYLAENGVCLTHEFREGNVAAQAGALKFLKRCVRLCPKIKRLRSDSAYYQAEVLNWCEEKELGFTITADQDAGVKGVIGTVRDWKPLVAEDGTAVHMMNRSREPFRLVIQRWSDPQLSLYEPNGYCYQFIATNREELSAEEVVWFHNRRGQVENSIKELKIGFGMEQMTSGEFGANALWFALGVLASNLTQAMKLLFLDPEWKSKTIGTLRWQLILRLAASAEKYLLFLRARERLRAFL